MDLVVDVYRATECFPRHETYGLAQQLRRAAVSIASNIAEGQARDHLGDYLHHLSIANGSLMELETQILIAGRLGYVGKERQTQILSRTAEAGRMLAGLSRALRQRSRTHTPHR